MPLFLRHSGWVDNLGITKAEVELMIKEIWSSKSLSKSGCTMTRTCSTCTAAWGMSSDTALICDTGDQRAAKMGQPKATLPEFFWQYAMSKYVLAVTPWHTH